MDEFEVDVTVSQSNLVTNVGNHHSNRTTEQIYRIKDRILKFKNYIFVVLVVMLLITNIFTFIFMKTRDDPINSDGNTREKQNNVNISGKNDNFSKIEDNIDNGIISNTEISPATGVPIEESHNVSEPINRLGICLKNLTHDSKFVSDLVSSVRKCNRDDDAIVSKTKIRFVMGISDTIYCEILNRNCESELMSLVHGHLKEIGVKDAYHNYILGSDGILYEGRPIGCIDEYSLKLEAKSELIVGMPYCDFLDTFEIKNVSASLKQIFNCFITNDILTRDFTAEFHNNCSCKGLLSDITYLYGNKIQLYDKNTCSTQI